MEPAIPATLPRDVARPAPRAPSTNTATPASTRPIALHTAAGRCSSNTSHEVASPDTGTNSDSGATCAAE